MTKERMAELLQEEGGPFLAPKSFPYKPSVPEELIAAVVSRVHAQHVAAPHANSDTLKKSVSPHE